MKLLLGTTPISQNGLNMIFISQGGFIDQLHCQLRVDVLLWGWLGVAYRVDQTLFNLNVPMSGISIARSTIQPISR